jgi:hypothetical protein
VLTKKIFPGDRVSGAWSGVMKAAESCSLFRISSLKTNGSNSLSIPPSAEQSGDTYLLDTEKT